MKIRPGSGRTRRRLARAERLFMFYGFPDLRYVLSAYDPDIETIVVAPEIVARCPLLHDIMGPERIVVLEDPPEFVHPPPPPADWPRHFLPLFLAAWRLKSWFRPINRSASVRVFNDFNVFPFFVLAGMFRRMGLRLEFTSVLPWLRTEPSPPELLATRPPHLSRYLEWLSRAGGVRIIEALYRPVDFDEGAASGDTVTAVGYAMAEPVPEVEVALRSWPELMSRFELTRFEPREKSVLVIPTPFEPFWPKVDVARTHARVAAYFAETLGPDVKVHLKPHYRDPQKNILADTALEDRVHLLDPFVPAEVYMQFYDDIFFFSSSSAATPCPGRKHSLSDLIVFETEEERQRYFRIESLSYGAEALKINRIKARPV